MSNTPNIIILAGTRPDDIDFEGNFPYYLSEADRVPLIQSLIEKCSPLNPNKIICMLPEEEVNKFHLRNMISQMHQTAIAFPIYKPTMGAACTALLASENIDNDSELVIISANEILEESFSEIVTKFRNDNNDAGVVIFKSLHPRYAFVRLNETGKVVEAAEKNPISANAVGGMYWFKNGSIFVDAVKSMIRKDAKVNGYFYVAPALNELILMNRKVGVYRVDPSKYRPLKNAAQINAYESQGGRA
ncbi:MULTISPECIES: glycosyltransferase family 2 protein [Pseudomonadaceae]|jgi:dTDP-glucose pyrophosphorylase|uniref:glycosyltransferase family 2 protein n=1 Tax=Pseudomonadaceae TaxID=135621 RepID=UPI0005C97500|nr:MULTISPECIES: glycosyltransferase family 2 protein [Pseudomonas]MBO2927893.1 glycosyltransferase family 2 protein [Pseudomonas otitidis]